MHRRSVRTAAASAAILLAAATGMNVLPSPARATPGVASDITARDRAAGIARQLAAGLQVTPKDAPIPVGQPDPTLALLPDLSKVNFARADQLRAAKGKARARQAQIREAFAGKMPARRMAPSARALAYAEREATEVAGANDEVPTAEQITDFGTSSDKNPRVSITGNMAPSKNIPMLPAPVEDDGAIELATETGVTDTRTTVRISAAIGDGPHGGAGDQHGDFDYYKVSGVPAGTPLTVDVDTPTGDLDSVLTIWNARGGGVLFNDNDGTDNDSLISMPLPTTEDYYIMVSGFGVGTVIPDDPHDPASGVGIGSEGPYDLTISAGVSGDQDVFSIDLRAGDVVGASVTGAGRHLSLFDAIGNELMGSSIDATGGYPSASPLPGGGNATVDLVAPRSGRYALAVSDGAGGYAVTLEAYRPGTSAERRGTVQTLFLDFDGARVNTRIFGTGGGQRELSPLSAFLDGWGLTPADEDKLIDTVVDTVSENIARDSRDKGSNPGFAVRIRNSRDHADTFGQPNVSRVIVGGTMMESGIATIGISESVDPGNFGHEETALVLLDLLSGPEIDPNSLSFYLDEDSDKIDYIGRALGNIVTHEAGHFSGSWHTYQFNSTANLMDQGGNPAQLTGVGQDNIGGNSDDEDVDFTTDIFNITEPFRGTLDSLNSIAWGYSRGIG